MNKISREKQVQLAFVAIAIVGIIGAMWYFLMSAQKARIADIGRKCAGIQDEMTKQKRVIASAASTGQELADATNRLQKIEGTMPSGDLYSWIVSNVREFNAPSYKVTINQIGTPDPSDVRMFPGFPYTQVSFNLTGSAYYADLGKFLSDFENEFPYMRVQNISLDPIGGTAPQDKEKLFFRMEVIHLLKPAPTLVASR